MYIAYFGSGIAKAAIKSDSRSSERLYEQGALLDAIVASCPNATVAHNLECRLICGGLKNSVTKKQKSDIYKSGIDVEFEKKTSRAIIDNLDYSDKEIVSNLDMFFFGNCPHTPVEPFGDRPKTGKITGVAGRYLVLENIERYNGFWLSESFGYKVTIGRDAVS